MKDWVLGSTSNEPTCEALFLFAVPDLNVINREKEKENNKKKKKQKKNTQKATRKIPSISVCCVCLLTSFCRIY